MNKSYGEKFAATKLWTSILRKFYNEMPLKRHRRQLRMFNDSFTGREAVDFLFSFLPDLWPRECSRNTAVNLAKMFLKSGYLVNARNEEDREFYDNVALYGFCSSKIESFLNDVPFSSNETPAKSTSRNVRRISSFKADALESYRKGNENYNTLKWEQSKDVINRADYTSPAVPSGRLSMSCGDLTSIPPRAEKRLLGIPLLSARLFSSASKNPKALPASVVVKETKDRSSPWSNGSPLFRRSARRLNTPVLQDRAGTKVEKEIINAKAPVAITDADEFKLWKYCLIERLKQALGIVELGKLAELLNLDFFGADVRWNCKMIGEQKIVAKIPENHDELPGSLIDSLRKLASWPHPPLVSSQSGSHNRERTLFGTVCRGLVALSPIIPLEVARSVVAIYGLFKAMKGSEASTPPRAGRRENFGTVLSPSRMATQTRQQKHQLLINDHLITDIPPYHREKFILCIRLLLLTLKPNIRRKLQIILRHLRRIARNSRLKLKSEQQKDSSENRLTILERLSALFIAPTTQISELKSARFLAFFMDNLQELLIDLPVWLEADVQQKVENLISGKELLTISNGMPCVSRQIPGDCRSVFGARQPARKSGTPPAPLATTFCDRIGTSAYEEQRSQLDDQLLQLLDSTISNENLKPKDKAKWINDFRVTYPRLYAIRFPPGTDTSEFEEATDASTFSQDKSTASARKNPGAPGSNRLLERFRQIITLTN
ncbi:domain found in dishevelled, egl-10, and pleckstrin (DEP) domain-containing protein [Ditylenchus destructor]|uniref:Domain found in dishevelled, egl-10, and pleckstrin (DEP) domain-containing protein n=1 Tax=Ditylenchus destructor TaxID=166010 RepID=A0AAD4R076_9BILA|nr:domain found in dishevelled, egl-10, and pleckstrin (DEP) domain-containing protein [Ditylenchus destructor]